MKYKVILTRDTRGSQSAEVIVEAKNRSDAESKAMELPQQDIAWTDDFFEAGEGGTYVADESNIKEIENV